MEEGFDDSDFSGGKASEFETPFFTPFQKPDFPKSDIEPFSIDFSLSPGGDSSADSMKESSGSCYSSLSSYSDSQSSNPSVNTDEKILPEGVKQDNILLEGEKKSYDELLRRFIKNEEELKVSNSKLQFSEMEITQLKIQIEESEGLLGNVRKELKMKEDDLEYEKGQVLELQKQTAELETHIPDCSHKIANLKIQIEESEGQLDNVRKELKNKEDDLEYEKGQVMELQKLTAELETHVPDCSNKIEKLVQELEVAQEQLKVSNDEKTRLKEELKSRYAINHELQCKVKEIQDAAQQSEATVQWLRDWGGKRSKELEDKITQHQANETEHDHEVRKLKAEIDDLKSDISRLSKSQKLLDSRLKEWEARSKVSQRKMKQSEAEKVKLEKLHANQKLLFKAEITSLKEELDHKRHDVEAVNKEFDQHKQKYDMLMTEIDEANAKVDKLMAEVSSRDNQIAKMKTKLVQLQAQQPELISRSEARLNLVNELKLKVEDLENKVTIQNAVISDRAEEKREAIRQLCISIEHYRSEYRELRRAFAGHEHHSVTAS
ncbi:PREDICTED: protein NETWORKED 4A-like isoform X2 [Lupinus angustifolius]|uniref:protein NETWORKED 4A-like isoform X2 n=1 Tax=Lupinus angustifolius TaxID=3871 RepID=UPI00092E4838|nr:PREDICTED: protein NETWORKED 4A-like isoform X2 [Lupinus angustifolius]